MEDGFSLERFSRYLNSKFTVKRESASALELELIEARDVGSTPWLEQFSIVFRGPRDPSLAQATYDVEHDGTGPFQMFIVPIRQDNNGVYYEAIFNRTLQ